MKRKQTQDYVKASRKGSREAEIALHGHPVPQHKVHRSEKTYNRAKAKAGLRNRPFDFYYLCLELKSNIYGYLRIL